LATGQSYRAELFTCRHFLLLSLSDGRGQLDIELYYMPRDVILTNCLKTF